jgi:outer membrane lipoprotein carrier protein
MYMVSLSAMAVAPEVEKALDTMTSFEADFVQTVVDDKLFREEKSSGKVWVQRPGKFFWRYDTGAQKMDIIADGVNLWIYQADLKQVMVQQLADIADELPISWLASGQPVGQRYNTRKLEEKSEGLSWFDLQNKKGGTQEIAFIELAMQGDMMKQVRLTSSDGKITLVKFSQPKRNNAIDPERFVFRPAPGIDIIGTPQ